MIAEPMIIGVLVSHANCMGRNPLISQGLIIAAAKKCITVSRMFKDINSRSQAGILEDLSHIGKVVTSHTGFRHHRPFIVISSAYLLQVYVCDGLFDREDRMATIVS